MRFLVLKTILATFITAALLAPTSTVVKANMVDSTLMGLNVIMVPLCPENTDSTDPADVYVMQNVTQCKNDVYELGNWVGGTYEDNKPHLSAMSTGYNYIGYMIDNPPADTVSYVADLRQNFILIPTAQAQGIGFGSLNFILDIWKVFLNLAYFVFVLIIAGVGFAIMFRAKLNPQTVVNIQLALPRIVITLLIITFSYAIAGLMIDVMYLSIFVIIGALAAAGIGITTEAMSQTAFANNVFGNMHNFLFGADGGMVRSVASVSSITANIFGADTLSSSVTDILQQSPAYVFAGGAGVLFFFVFSVVILWNTFKIFFSLLVSYIQIIFLVIFAPLRLLLNAFPGSTAFTDWLKELAGHLAVFPTVTFLFFVASILLQNSKASVVGNSFSPPQLNTSTEAIPGIIAIGILLTIPQILDKVKTVFGGGGGGGKGGGGGAFAGGLGGAALGSIAGPMAAPFKLAGRFVGGQATSLGGELASGYLGDKINNLDMVRRFNTRREWDAQSRRSAAAQKRGEMSKFRAAGGDYSAFQQQEDARVQNARTAAQDAKRANSSSGGSTNQKPDVGGGNQPRD